MLGGMLTGRVVERTTRIYLAFDRRLPLVAQRVATWARLPRYVFTTAAAEWANERAHAASCDVVLDSADYIVVGCDLTGEIDERGCLVLRLDWNDVTEATTL